jgi:hypothetical protein
MFPCIVINLDVAVNNIKSFSVAMEMQECVLLVLRLHAKRPIFVSNFDRICSCSTDVSKNSPGLNFRKIHLQQFG